MDHQSIAIGKWNLMIDRIKPRRQAEQVSTDDGLKMTGGKKGMRVERWNNQAGHLRISHRRSNNHFYSGPDQQASN